MQKPIISTVGRGFFLFVGARPETLLPDNGVDEILLLQPDPVVASKLERATEGQAHIRILAASIDKEAGWGCVNVMNMAALSSLRRPTPALLNLLPGLKTIATRDARILSAGDLDIPVCMDRHSLSLRVRVDMAGSEMDILSCLDEAGLLETTVECIVHCSSDVFFEGGCNYQTVTDFLIEKGFVPLDRDDTDPDWPVLRFYGNPQFRYRTAARISGLEAMLASVRAEAKAVQKIAADREATLAKLERGNATAKTASEELQIMAQERLTALELALNGAQAEAEAARQVIVEQGNALAALGDERKTNIIRISELEAALVAEKAASDKAAVEARERISRLEAECNKLHGDAATRAETTKSLEATLAAREADLSDLNGKVESFTARMGELETERNKLHGDAAARAETIKSLETIVGEGKNRITQLEIENKRTFDLQADISFQLRMNALLRNDLDELSRRFEGSEKKRLRLEELLRTLTSKLQQAADELHLLQASSLRTEVMVEGAGDKSKIKRGRRERNA